MIELAAHLANLPTGAMHTINQDSLDLKPSPDSPPSKTLPATSCHETLDRFDKNITDARAAIADASDEHLLSSWTLLSGGKVIFELRPVAVLRNFVMNHNIHHRAQLGVYLRLNDVAVPAIYGQSTDEGSI